MKLITVPIDKEAEKRLNFNENIECDLISVFLNKEDYNAIWKTSFYDEINNKLGVFIDDCESEEITDKEKLKKLHSIILKYEKEIDNPIFPTLKSLTEAAIRFDTGVYFFF